MSCLVQTSRLLQYFAHEKISLELHKSSISEFWGITGLSQPQGLGLGSKATSLSVFFSLSLEPCSAFVVCLCLFLPC